MILYDALTPSSLRVRVFLAEKGIDLEKRPVAVLEGETRTPEFLQKNPLGELPLLALDDGAYLAESVAICRYLEALHPEPNMFGRTDEEQARIEMWNRRAEQHFLDVLGGAARHSFPFFKDRIEQIPAFAAASMRVFDQKLIWLNETLSDGRPFLAGDRFSIADATLTAPLFICDMMEKTLPEELTNLKAYERRLRERPSFSRSLQPLSK